MRRIIPEDVEFWFEFTADSLGVEQGDLVVARVHVLLPPSDRGRGVLGRDPLVEILGGDAN